jgi:hypothetical protein
MTHKPHVPVALQPCRQGQTRIPSVVSSNPRCTRSPARCLLLLPTGLLVTKQFGTCAMEFARRFTAIKDAGCLLKQQFDLSARPPDRPDL